MVDKVRYMREILEELEKTWPDNRTVNIVCHGHSVPSGYAFTPYINTFQSYPHLLHEMIAQKFPFSVVNVIVTAIGGETAREGAARFERDVLNHDPDLITIDYALNDRTIGLNAARAAWEKMIELALQRNKKVILMTPTWDASYFDQSRAWTDLAAHTEQIRALAEQYQVGLADVFAAYERFVGDSPERLVNLLSYANHPSPLGHRLAARELDKFFLAGSTFPITY